MKKLYTLLLVATAFIAQAQTTRYVNFAATGSNDGSSWTNAYTNLQTAIAASSTGDILWVAQGTYKPHASDVTVSFSINGLSLYGGFAGGETNLSQRDVINHPTILSGDLNGDDVGLTNNYENSYHVVLVQSSGNVSVIDGFTVIGGNANGGVGDPRLGGGIKISDGTATTLKIYNCILKYNKGANGGGLYVYSTTGAHTVLVENCVFDNNYVDIYGSAIYKFGNISLTVTNCSFLNNNATTFYSNLSSGYFKVYNSLTYFSTPNSSYIRGDNSATFLFDHSLFPDDPSANAAITTFTNNLINKDAMVNADYTLQASSPAINAGNNSILTTSIDMAGKNRINNTTVDLGAIEYYAVSAVNIANAADYGLSVFPNPATDRLSFELKGNQKITTITLYNTQGEVCYQKMYSSSDNVEADLQSLNSGLYYAKVEIDGTEVVGVKIKKQ
jgi:hypothetical protein